MAKAEATGAAAAASAGAESGAAAGATAGAESAAATAATAVATAATAATAESAVAAVKATMKATMKAAIILIGLAFLTACAQPDNKLTETGDKSDDDNSILVGVSMLDMSNPYYSEVIRGMKEEADVRNIQLIIRDPKSDATLQVRDVEEFIENNVDAIAIAALSPELLEPVLARAREQDIVVVAWATEVEACDVHIAADEWDMGYRLGFEAGLWLVGLPEDSRKIAILDYPRIPQIENRVKGIKDGLMTSAGNVSIIAQSSASTPEEGYISTVRILKDHPDTCMILAINDGGALGALEAIEQTGMPKEDFFIGGCDATPEARGKISEGSAFRCTVDIYPHFTGKVNIDFVSRILNGESVPARYTVPARIIKESDFPE